MKGRWHLLLRSGAFVSGLLIILFWALCALVGRLFAPFDPFAADVLSTLSPPSTMHWFGTDQLGRDVLSRVIVGSRDVLEVAPLATALGLALGVLLGLTTGYFRGIFDEAVSRIIDAVLALPLVIIALLALSALGASSVTVIVVVGCIFTPLIARTVRAAVLAERELEYVAAARLRNESTLRILLGEILPNIMPPVLVEGTVRLGYAIFAVASLSFLGFGIQPPSPDWGLAVSESYGLINGGIWWPALFNTLAISSLIVAVNLTADGLQATADA